MDCSVFVNLKLHKAQQKHAVPLNIHNSFIPPSSPGFTFLKIRTKVSLANNVKCRVVIIVQMQCVLSISANGTGLYILLS